MGVQFNQEDDIQLFQRFQAGDVKAGDVIIQKHMGLVRSYVYSIAQSGMFVGSWDDLVQSGIEGLVSARNQFDLRRANKFCTFAYYKVRKFVNEARDKERKYRDRHELSETDCNEGGTDQTSESLDINGGCEDQSADEAILYSDMKAILTTREFEIWRLKEHGKSITDIGKFFGVSRQRIHQLLERARPKIQEYLSRN